MKRRPLKPSAAARGSASPDVIVVDAAASAPRESAKRDGDVAAEGSRAGKARRMSPRRSEGASTASVPSPKDPIEAADPLIGLQISKRWLGAGWFDGVVTQKLDDDHYEISWSDDTESTMTSKAISKCKKIAS